MKTYKIALPILAMSLFASLSAQAKNSQICKDKKESLQLTEQELKDCNAKASDQAATDFILELTEKRRLAAEDKAKKLAEEKAAAEKDKEKTSVESKTRTSEITLNDKKYTVVYTPNETTISATVTEADSACTVCTTHNLTIQSTNMNDLLTLNKAIVEKLSGSKSDKDKPEGRTKNRAELADDEDATDTEDDSIGQKKLNALHDKCEDLDVKNNKALNCYLNGLKDIFKLKKDERPSEQEMIRFYTNYIEQDMVDALNKEHQEQDGKYFLSSIRSTPEISNKVAELIRRIPSRYGDLHREILGSVELSLAQITADRQRTYVTTQYDNDPYRRQAGLNQFAVDRNAILNRTYMQERSLFNAFSQSELFREKPFEARSMYDAYINDLNRFRAQLTTQGGEFNPFSLMVARSQQNDIWSNPLSSLDTQRTLLNNPYTQQQIPQQQLQQQPTTSLLNPNLPGLPPLSSLPGLSMSNQTMTTQSTSLPSVMNVPQAITGTRTSGRLQ